MNCNNSYIRTKRMIDAAQSQLPKYMCCPSATPTSPASSLFSALIDNDGTQTVATYLYFTLSL